MIGTFLNFVLLYLPLTRYVTNMKTNYDRVTLKKY